ncbi:MAG TPA: hypothetical protein V6D10_01325 [Trichocoleus sp.]|jgi:hypothetical protein
MTLTLHCQHCYSANLAIGDGAGPHYAKLYCLKCGRFARWLSAYQSKSFSRHSPSTRQKNLFEQEGDEQ